MGELTARRERLQSLVGEAWAQLFRPELSCPPVICFGSNVYGLATSTSDWDFALLMPDEHKAYSKVLRAKVRQALCEKGLSTWFKIED